MHRDEQCRWRACKIGSAKIFDVIQEGKDITTTTEHTASKSNAANNQKPIDNSNSKANGNNAKRQRDNANDKGRRGQAKKQNSGSGIYGPADNKGQSPCDGCVIPTTQPAVVQ